MPLPVAQGDRKLEKKPKSLEPKWDHMQEPRKEKEGENRGRQRRTGILQTALTGATLPVVLLNVVMPEPVALADPLSGSA